LKRHVSLDMRSGFLPVAECAGWILGSGERAGKDRSPVNKIFQLGHSAFVIK
jgi:hypothetical protein